MPGSVHICSFQGIPDVVQRRGRRNWYMPYEEFREHALKAGRFSAFEATANNHAAALFTRLCRDPEIETDKSMGFPWTGVRLKEVARVG